METQTFSEDVRRYLLMLWQWAWLLILVMILVSGATWLISSQITPVYQASTSVLINEAPTTKSADYASILTSERLTQTYSQLMIKQPVLDGVINKLGLPLNASELKRMIQVQPVRDTQLIEVRVEDIDPVRAAMIANALVTEFSEQSQALQSSRYAASKQSLEQQLNQLDQQIQQAAASISTLGDTPTDLAEKDRLQSLQAQYRQTYAYLLQSYEAVRLAEAQSTSNVVQVEPAIPNGTPIRPRVMTNTILAGVVGLMLAIGMVFLVESLDDTLRNPDDISRRLGLPILGMIARYQNDEPTPITISQPRTPVAEAFRSLRTNIQFASVDRPLQAIMVTSPSPGDGKSTIAVNLAIVMAQSDRSVVMVDADLRRPRIHKSLRLSNRRGVSDLFVQPQIILDGSVQRTETPNLSVLTSGSLPPNPSELLGSERMAEILRQVRQQANLVIVDTPPVLAVTDAAVLAPRVDGVLLVVRPGITKVAALRQAVEQIRHVGAHLLGVVLNDVELKRVRYYYSYKGYYYTYYDQYESDSDSRSRSRKGKKPVRTHA